MIGRSTSNATVTRIGAATGMTVAATETTDTAMATMTVTMAIADSRFITTIAGEIMVIAIIAGSATGTTATTATTMVIDANFFCMSRSRDQGPHHAPLLR